jgi:hypothetical protein
MYKKGGCRSSFDKARSSGCDFDVYMSRFLNPDRFFWLYSSNRTANTSNIPDSCSGREVVVNSVELGHSASWENNSKLQWHSLTTQYASAYITTDFKFRESPKAS